MIAGAFHAAERGLDRCFGSAANPLRQLGAASYWLFWAAAASGVYVYAFYDTGVATSHASVEHLSSAPRALGGLMRSMHRYASDGLALATALHLAREFAYDRYRGFRWFTWTTGVPLIALTLACGVVGYWLVWDVLAQFVGIAAAEWLAALPGVGPALVRNFIAPEAVTDRFFSLLVFAHIAVSLLLLLGMWIHVQRLAGARVQPDRRLGFGLFATLLALALAVPAVSQPEADLARAPLVLAMDWFYLFAFPLADLVPAGLLWLAIGAVTLALFALPWTARTPPVAAAVVQTDECNGCGLCDADCPYGAVRLVAAADGGVRAQVIDALCAGCGICVGACPSASPFRSGGMLKSGIELAQLPVQRLRTELEHALQGSAAPCVVAFGCDHGARVGSLASAHVATLSLPCIGMLPPSFVDYALKRGAAGVMVAGCAAGDCEHRFGDRWLAARLSGERMPRARLAGNPARVRLLDDAGDERRLAVELAAFRAVLDVPARGGAMEAGAHA
jgi:ferredoxin/coenzyme F420-reducing hydrogenase delta subunit